MHGVLATPMPAQKGDIKAAVLVLHGAADPVSPKAHRDMFEAEMDAAGARWYALTFGNVRARLYRSRRQHSAGGEIRRAGDAPRLHAGACLHRGCVRGQAVRSTRSDQDGDGRRRSIRGRILPHEHLQIDLSAQKGPANKIGEEEQRRRRRGPAHRQGIWARRDHRPERAVVGPRSGGACAASASRRAWR